MIATVKTAVRSLLARYGYTVRHVGARGTVTGVDLLHDLSALLPSDRPLVLFDVGANIGQTIDAFRAVWPSARITAFEPSPRTFATLSQTHSIDAVRLEQQAVGDSVGAIAFHVTEQHSVNDSVLPPTWSGGVERVQVPITTVDAYCSDHAIESIDVLKIDTQGYDLHVLQGAMQMLQERRIGALTFEIMGASMYTGQARLEDAFALLRDTPYELLGFYEQTYIDNRLSYLNVCFVCHELGRRVRLEPSHARKGQQRTHS